MPNVNQIMAFATGPNARVLTPDQYAVLAARVGGFVAGVADEVQLNTVWRQSSFVSAMVAQFIADNAQVDVLDNGDITTLETNFKAAVAAIAAGAISVQTIAQAQPIFPEILTSGNVFAYTSSPGSVSLSPGQAWQHRGLNPYNTSMFATALSFGTTASSVYHWVWDAPGTGLAQPKATYPNGSISLINRTGAVPAETDPGYDTTYDRMLFGRVVTDASNNPTVTMLINRQFLSGMFTENVFGGTGVYSGNVAPDYTSNPRIIFDCRPSSGDGAGRCQSRFVTNYGRTPRNAAATGYVGFQVKTGNPSVPYTYQEGGQVVTSKIVSRYATIINFQTDYNLSGIVDSAGNFILSNLFAVSYCDINANG